MITLEKQITGETCVNLVRILKESYVSEQEIHCYNCPGDNKSCPDYRPVKLFELQLNSLRLRN